MARAKGNEFEKAFQELEQIVHRLEGEELSLDDSLKLFEQGINLSRFCHQKLEEVEKKIELILSDAKGTPVTEPFLFEEEEGGTRRTTPAASQRFGALALQMDDARVSGYLAEWKSRVDEMLDRSLPPAGTPPASSTRRCATRSLPEANASVPFWPSPPPRPAGEHRAAAETVLRSRAHPYVLPRTRRSSSDR